MLIFLVVEIDYDGVHVEEVAYSTKERAEQQVIDLNEKYDTHNFCVQEVTVQDA